MKFEFTPSNHGESFKEYIRYISLDIPPSRILSKTVIPAIITLMSYVIIANFSQYFNSIINNSLILAVILIFALLIVFIVKMFYLKASRSLKNNKLYCDLESNFAFTLEDGYFIRENQFSTIKVALKEIATIRLLKQGLILSSENQQILLFIPIAVLPISVKDFIEIFKTANPKLTLENVYKKNKKQLLIKGICLIVICYLALVASHFIGKYNHDYNFKTYDLTTEDQMVTLMDNSFLYENQNLQYSIVFPESWSGKFGIEETEDYINVYYLENGEQGPNTSLLFTVRDEKNSPPFMEYNELAYKFTEPATYVLWGPKQVDMDDGSNAYLEYVELYKEIATLSLKALY